MYNGKKSYAGGAVVSVSGAITITLTYLSLPIGYSIGIALIGIGLFSIGMAHKVSKLSRNTRGRTF